MGDGGGATTSRHDRSFLIKAERKMLHRDTTSSSATWDPHDTASTDAVREPHLPIVDVGWVPVLEQDVRIQLVVLLQCTSEHDAGSMRVSPLRMRVA